MTHVASSSPRHPVGARSPAATRGGVGAGKRRQAPSGAVGAVRGRSGLGRVPGGAVADHRTAGGRAPGATSLEDRRHAVRRSRAARGARHTPPGEPGCSQAAHGSPVAARRGLLSSWANSRGRVRGWRGSATGGRCRRCHRHRCCRHRRRHRWWSVRCRRRRRPHHPYRRRWRRYRHRSRRWRCPRWRHRWCHPKCPTRSCRYRRMRPTARSRSMKWSRSCSRSRSSTTPRSSPAR
jgi:hypothetical protein